MTQTAATMSVDEVVTGLFAIWNETNALQRRELTSAIWTEDASYVDSMFEAHGQVGLDSMVAGVQEQFPGYIFRVTGPIDQHHDRARWTWELSSPDGGVVAVGTDFAVLAPDGRLHEVTGFFEQVPESA